MNFVFPHSWQAEVLPGPPLIKPLRCYTYPRQIEEEAEAIARGALEVMVQPASKGLRFLATFALGFADPSAPSGLWSCPEPDELCAVAGGYAYVVDTLNPARFTFLPFRPVLQVLPLPEHNLLLFSGHNALLAWSSAGREWETPRLSSEGIRITEIHGDQLSGFGWDLLTDREVPFTIDLHTGERTSPHSIR